MNTFDFFIESLNLDAPNFDKAERVMDWRNYVPLDWQKHWDEFTEREKKIIATMAQMQADSEEWD